MGQNGLLLRTYRQLESKFEIGEIELTDFLLAAFVRDAIKLDLGENTSYLWSICTREDLLLPVVGEHLTRLHYLNINAYRQNRFWAHKQNNLLKDANARVHEWIALQQERDRNWRSRVCKMMEERPGPAPTTGVSSLVEEHLCTDREAIEQAVEIVEKNFTDIEYVIGSRLNQFLRTEFDDTERSPENYIEDLVIIGIYLGPVSSHEAENPPWACHHKGRATQHAHEWFGSDEVVNDNRLVAASNLVY